MIAEQLISQLKIDQQVLNERHCFANAAVAWLKIVVAILEEPETLNRIFNTEEEQILQVPEIYDIRFPNEFSDKAFDSETNAHAYLSYAGQIFSKGITWPDDLYPALNQEQLHELVENGSAKNVTANILDWMRGHLRDPFLDDYLGLAFIRDIHLADAQLNLANVMSAVNHGVEQLGVED